MFLYVWDGCGVSVWCVCMYVFCVVCLVCVCVSVVVWCMCVGVWCGVSVHVHQFMCLCYVC